MSKPRINTDESVAGALFAELGKHNDDAAMEIMRENIWIAREYQHNGQEGILLLERGIIKKS